MIETFPLSPTNIPNIYFQISIDPKFESIKKTKDPQIQTQPGTIDFKDEPATYENEPEVMAQIEDSQKQKIQSNLVEIRHDLNRTLSLIQ